MRQCLLLLLLLLLRSALPLTFPDREVWPCIVLPLATPTLTVSVPAHAPWRDSNLTGLLLESRDNSQFIAAIASAIANFPPRARIQVFHSPANARSLYAAFLPLIA